MPPSFQGFSALAASFPAKIDHLPAAWHNCRSVAVPFGTSLIGRRYGKGVIDGKTKTQTMIDAGYSKTTAAKRQQLVFGRERVQDAFVAAFESQGLRTDRLARIIEGP